MSNTTGDPIAAMSAQELVEILEGIAERAETEINQPIRQMFVSFWDTGTKSTDDEWLGGVVVIARGPIDAALQLFDHNLYPGGMSEFYDIPIKSQVKEIDMYRPLNRNDVVRLAKKEKEKE